MRFRLPLAILLGLFGIAPATGFAQDDTSAAKRTLDKVLAVLRDHQSAAGKPCLEAMTRVHQTEDQVAGLGQQDSNSNHPDNGADVARDVLESDYDTAEAACHPDAVRACAGSPSDRNCARMEAGPPG